jgi:hypothetical protein
MSDAVKKALHYLVLTTAIIGGLGPTVAQLNGHLPPSYLTLAIHAVAVAAAIHLYFIQSPLFVPLLAVRKLPPRPPTVLPLPVFTILLPVLWLAWGCLNPVAVPPVIGGGISLVQCVSGEIAKGDDTFEDIATACGAQTIAEVIGIVEVFETVPQASTATLSTQAKLVHHKAAKK